MSGWERSCQRRETIAKFRKTDRWVVCETYKDYCFCYMPASVEIITGVKPQWH